MSLDEVSKRIERGMRGLPLTPEDMKAAILSMRAKTMSDRQIAAALDIPVAEVKAMAQEAMASLEVVKNILEAQKDGPFMVLTACGARAFHDLEGCEKFTQGLTMDYAVVRLLRGGEKSVLCWNSKPARKSDGKPEPKPI